MYFYYSVLETFQNYLIYFITENYILKKKNLEMSNTFSFLLVTTVNIVCKKKKSILLTQNLCGVFS